MKHTTKAVAVVALPLAGLAGSGVAHAQGGESEATGLDPVVVTGTRTETPLSEVARSVTVVDREQIEEQSEVDQNLGEILARTVPGLAPSTESPSNFSQTLRGRNFLVLVDGIPQSTALRESGRALNTISASAIERIEVVRGGTAVYGFGATGGVVNVITKEPAEEELERFSRLGGRISTEHVDDSGEVETEHRISGASGQWDYLLSGSYLSRGGHFDADGDRIPPDPIGSQGGFADSDEYNFLAKTGFEFDQGRQRVEFMLNHFRNEQDTDFAIKTDNGQVVLEDGHTVAVPLSEAESSAIPATEPGTENTTGRATYVHRDIAGSSVQADLYFGDREIIFPKFAGVFGGIEFPQTGNETEKVGARTTVDTPLAALSQGATLTWGVDAIDETARATVFGTSEEPSGPDLDQQAIAGFAELELPVGDVGLIRGGVRHEEIDVDVDTLQSNRNGNTVEGGSLDFSETLFNLGAVFFATESTDLFVNYSEGFTVGDLGRVIQDAGAFGAGDTFQASQFETDAEKAENYEIGLRHYGDPFQATLAVFYSETKNGRSFDRDLRIRSQDEEIWGIEGTADYRLTDRASVGGTATWVEGDRVDDDGDERPLDGSRIPPLKLTAHVEHQTRDWWENRVQALYVGDRDEFSDNPDPSIGSPNEVRGYVLVDVVSTLDLGPGELNLSVRNLFNRDYKPAFSQASGSDFARSNGRGRTVGASYNVRW